MNEHTLNFTEQGFWCRPDSPDKTIAGTISYSSGKRLVIELLGSLASRNTLELATRFEVWGNTASGKRISLFRAFQTETKFHFPGCPTSRIEAGEGIVGGHYRTRDEALVHTIEVEMEHLNAWSQLDRVVPSYNSMERKCVITAHLGERIQLGQKGDINISVVPWVATHPSEDGLSISQWRRLQLESDSPKPFANFEPIIQAFQRFLSLAAGEPARLLRILGKTPEKQAEIDGKPIWSEIDIIQSFSRSEAPPQVRPERMLFTLQDLQQSYTAIFDKFLSKEPMLEPVFDLFFPTYFFDLPPPQELLNMAHAIEAFHRATIGGQYQTDEEYEAGLKQTFLAAIPPTLREDFKRSLRRRMDFAHQFSLKRRLKDLLRRFESLIAPFIGNRDSFIESATDARNRLVHASKDRPPPDYSTLWDLSQQLGLMLEISILAEIGFEEQEIARIIGRSKRADLIRNNVKVTNQGRASPS